MSELTRFCRVCKEEKPLSLLVPAQTYKLGHKPLCWKCKVEQDKVYKAKLNERKPNALVQPVKVPGKLNPTQMKSCGLGGWNGARVRGEHEALPPQINKMAGTYAPTAWALRPGANDHLNFKSRGV